MWEGEKERETLYRDITITLTMNFKICINSFTSNIIASIAAICSTITETYIEHSKCAKVCPTAVSLLVDAILARVHHVRSTND